MASAATDVGVQLVAKLLRGLGDTTRLTIVVALADHGEQRVTDLVQCLAGSQGNISGHLACLKDCGMVVDRPDGRAVWYSIASDDVIAVVRAAQTLLARTGQDVDLCPNYRPAGKQCRRRSSV